MNNVDAGVAFPELGFYTLPGHVDDPQRIRTEPAEGERLGLGAVWISERFGVKDVGVLSGVALAQTQRLGVVAGLMGQLPVRHPVATASYASTMATLTGDRFALGIGRGVAPLADATGTPRITFQLLEDYIGGLRSLWAGDRVHLDSPVGQLRGASLSASIDLAPPIIMAAMGDETCRWAGRHCDGVVLTSLWSPEAVAHSTRLVREGAEAAGRDPASVRVWAIVVTACDVSEEKYLRYIIRRMNTYLVFPGVIEDTCKANGWQVGNVARIREQLAAIDGSARDGGLGDEGTTHDLDQLRRMAEIYPEEWIHQGNAVGDAEHCAARIAERFAAGADSVLIHGSPPSELVSLLEAWPRHRPVERAAALPANPGRMA